MKSRLIAVFISTHETLRAERAFKVAGFKVRTTVKPRKIRSNCQLAITFPSQILKKILKVTQKESLDLTGLYRQDEDGQWAEFEHDGRWKMDG